MDVNHVLCPIDGTPGSARVLPVAAACRDLLGVPLRVFSAVEDPHEVGHRHAAVDFQVAAAVDGESEIIVVPAPHAPKAITAFAGDDGLVVMATTSRPHALHGYLGSATESVIRGVHRPVVAVGPSCRRDLGELQGVIVACDGSALSEQAIPAAKVWADLLGVELTVVSVLPPGGPQVSAETNYVRHLGRQVGANWDVLHGNDVARALTDFAEDQLIVMTTNGRSGFSRLRFGSVAAATIRWASGPVVVVNPQHVGPHDVDDQPILETLSP